MTTNSSSGVLDLERFYDVFEAMQQHDMVRQGNIEKEVRSLTESSQVLNLHGERPSTAPEAFTSAGEDGEEAVTVLDAEEAFLPTLVALHKRYPKLRIVLEHCTTRNALDVLVISCDWNLDTCLLVWTSLSLFRCLWGPLKLTLLYKAFEDVARLSQRRLRHITYGSRWTIGAPTSSQFVSP